MSLKLLLAIIPLFSIANAIAADSPLPISDPFLLQYPLEMQL